MIVHACAPTCLLEVGTWTDTEFAEHGATLGFASTFYTRVSLYPRGDARLVVRSLQPNHSDLEQFFRAASRYFGLYGVEVQVTVDLPEEIGVDFFPASAVAITGALPRVAERNSTPHQLALIAHGIQSGETNCPCGVQGFLTAAHGGVLLSDISPFPRAFPTPVELDDIRFTQIEESLLPVALGYVPSVDTYQRVESRCLQKDPYVSEIIWRLRALPRLAADAVKAGNFTAVGAILQEQGQLLRDLCPSILSPEVMHIEALARRYRVQVASVNGMGNIVTLFCPEGKNAVAERLIQAGYHPLNLAIDRRGLRVWSVEPEEEPLPKSIIRYARAA
jgi:galactokinase/mevalonate kinase-like predicted kinase